ncbi:hypothetical protein CYFUS_008315 [Cystobacter fuscus]|uniref:Uncharacterized protein n=1 Tax=Cystobacter fuscus TaxID=43 RepID=A0A250JI58_9BACT|nr:hypothetical protein CYFUS_008315 [Cystobacter fuscus]
MCEFLKANQAPDPEIERVMSPSLLALQSAVLRLLLECGTCLSEGPGSLRAACPSSRNAVEPQLRRGASPRAAGSKNSPEEYRMRSLLIRESASHSPG